MCNNGQKRGGVARVIEDGEHFKQTLLMFKKFYDLRKYVHTPSCIAVTTVNVKQTVKTCMWKKTGILW